MRKMLDPAYPEVQPRALTTFANGIPDEVAAARRADEKVRILKERIAVHEAEVSKEQKPLDDARAELVGALAEQEAAHKAEAKALAPPEPEPKPEPKPEKKAKKAKK